MSNRIASWAAITAVGVGAPLLAHAQPQLCEATGNYYEVIAQEGVGWEAARDAASAMLRAGVSGHLATITSAEEDACVEQFRAETFETEGPAQTWIGGIQTGTDEPGGGWEWVNGEGNIPGTDSVVPYADWASYEGTSEPNNQGGAENHLASGRFGLGLGWNDEGSAPESIVGFIVEYNTVQAAQDCLEGEDGAGGDFGCNITGAQNLELPNEALEKLEDGDTITQFYRRPDPALIAANVHPDVAAVCSSDVAFPDPRVNVHGRPVGPLRKLDVFAELGGGLPGEVIFNEFTYGSPCFALIEGGANFELVDVLPDGKGGVATLTQFPESVPGIGPTLSCYHAVDNPDLQQLPQFGYQTSDRNDLIEGETVLVTSFCINPSRAATFKFSFYSLNTHEDCGINYESRRGPVKVKLCFRSRALAMHRSLELSLRNAKLTLASPGFSQMNNTLKKAKLMIVAGQYARAYELLLDFQGMVEDATWNIDASNHPGNLIMRTENLLFRTELLQQAKDNLF